MPTPFHPGELAVQEHVGVRTWAERLSPMFRDHMPEQHRAFFAELPFVVVGSMDRDGWPWASILAAERGFLSTPDARTLRVSALPPAEDPLAAALTVGAPLGMLGIQLETRRRNRLNGRVRERDEAGFTLSVDQSFGNCPRYITVRTPHFSRVEARAEGALLSSEARALVARSDTLFIASASAAEPSADVREGVDVSHRGGAPGFVSTHGDDRTTLVLPDYDGNNAFNTIGNLVRHPRAGLLFVDFARGELLQIVCDSELLWDGPEVSAHEGAERAIKLGVVRGTLWTPAA